ncbi:MAG: peptide ABC transporter substrate-binding protein [Alphaproteobacteria bacterium]|nr:peptide ABC transporter substrate-binding protein [Alphaproteobacteria bacterium]
MTRCVLRLIGIALVLAAIGLAAPAAAQKRGGILRLWLLDSPASMSIHEEATVVAERPVMGVFNNLVLFDQHVPQNSMATIVPDLAKSWSWNEDGTELTFQLHDGVKWHDGKPFTAADVKCTWELLKGEGPEKLRVNPRKIWYANLDRITTNGDHEVTFHLKRPQPAFLALLASGMSPVYPCHVPPKDMRQHPLGTGPFKFVEFKPNESIHLTRNPDYWKPGLPYLDGIEYTIAKNRSTVILAFIAGKYDLTFAGSLTVPLTHDVEKQRPDAICEIPPGSVSTNLIVNREKPPFDNPELRRAMALAIDRKSFVDILTDGIGLQAAVMQPPPGGLWGMPKEMLQTLPGYGPDIEKNRAEARAIMQKLGYGPAHHMTVTVSTRDIPPYRDPAVILMDQLKEIYIDGNLEPLDTTQWYPRVMRKDYTVALNLTGTYVDDPDALLYENYACGGVGNYNGYCNPEVDKLIDQQSMEADQEKRKKLVWEIERKLTEDGARPLVYFNRGGACRDPKVKNLTIMINSIYNGWRMEDVWLDN